MTHHSNTASYVPNMLDIQSVSADIIRTLKKEKRLTNATLGSALGYSKDQIEDLEEEAVKKVPAHLFTAITRKYGVEYIKPYLDLLGVEVVENQPVADVNPLTALSSLLAKLAPCQVGPGQFSIDHVQTAAMMSDLLAASQAIGFLRSRAHQMGLI